MSEPETGAKNPIKSLQKSVRLLEAVKESDGARVTELADRLDMHKSSVHNYLSTLVEEEFVVKRDGEYHIGLRFLEFGGLARNEIPLYSVGRSQVSDLADETGELANLLVEEQGQGIYLYREVGDEAVRVDSYTGQRVHLHNTALGKAVLAHLPEQRVRDIIDERGMPQTTEQTITDEETLFEELASIREEGVAFDDEERLEGLRCVAVPIIPQDGTVQGAVSLSGPKSRIRGDRFTTELPAVIGDAVNIIELNLSYS